MTAFIVFFSNHVKKLSPCNSRGQAMGLCPFHEDRNPSFSVNLNTGLWFCFGCGEKGNFVSFYARIKGMSYKEAVRELGPKGQWQKSKENGLAQQLVAEFRQWCKEFHDNIHAIYRETGKRPPTGEDFTYHADYYKAYWDVRSTLEFLLEIMESRNEERKFQLFRELNNE